MCRIHVGAGGAEARDWAEMLAGMYRRWSRGRRFEVTEHTDGGTVLRIAGAGAYEAMRGEHGVHRLARVSPHGRGDRPQTSFAAVDVSPIVEDSPTAGLRPRDVRVETFRGSGPGGQHRNTRDSAVRALHVPSGLTAVCASQRSQHRNKRQAMQVLTERVAAADTGPAAVRRRPAGFGTRARSYTLHPYQLVTGHRSGYRSRDVHAVLNGALDPVMQAWRNMNASTSP